MQKVLNSLPSADSTSSTSGAAASESKTTKQPVFTGTRLPKRVATQDPVPATKAASTLKKGKLSEPDIPRSRYSSHHATGSFTSTAITPQTANKRMALSDEQVREQWYTYMKTQEDKKAYLRLVTNIGNINVQLHCDIAPRTCHNFLTLCAKGYYNGTKFHRLIPGFMIQGGDPTATGHGGESAWGKAPIKDEFSAKLKHDQRGILSMANSGPNTGKSQFFITFGPCSWLDNKHAIFGDVVGARDALDAMEKVPTSTDPSKKDRPVRDIVIQQVSIYQNPFDEPFEAVDEVTGKRSSDYKPKGRLVICCIFCCSVFFI